MAQPVRLQDGASGALFAVDTQRWERTVLIDCPSLPPPRSMGSCSAVASSPNGEWIAFSLGLGPGSDADGLYLFPATCVSDPTTCTSKLRGPFPLGLEVAWSPDGSLISSATPRDPPGPGIHILEASTGAFLRTVPQTESVNLVDGFAWSADGNSLALNTGPNLLVINAATGAVQREFLDDAIIKIEFWLHSR